jgi:putative endonuclease
MLHGIGRAARAPYVFLGAFFDRWYEEMPWRQRIPAGRRGEQIAARHLKRCGYLILARNYRAAGAEIDLVALDESTLVFIEVKLRGGADFGRPAEAVDLDKRERIRRAAHAFIEWRGAADLAARFDVVELNGVGRTCRLELLKDAF